MQLPIPLQQAIEQAATTIASAELQQAAMELSEQYRFRQSTATTFIATRAHRLAYVATRLPATYAALHAVLTEVKRVWPELEVSCLLDLGAGPGTAAWAATETLDELQTITLLERDRALIELGKSLAAQSHNAALRTAEWSAQDLTAAKSFPSHDLVIASYALGELPLSTARAVAQTAWQAATQALVLIEPGTMPGFALLRTLRDDLLRAGGSVIAPCPHAQACPMPADDWCHFAARVERSALHRKLKAGALGYEDEKFSYVVIAKQPVKSGFPRILRRPAIHPGFVKLELCTPQGLRSSTITRRDKAAFKRARKAAWGEAWEEPLD